ncbi:30S ribosomal protein S6e [Candidatus Bathyarchaeota archaeon]|nr:30S ribosomal protein S6e [Candidatus Bathyarchaeota archaeon]
MPKFKLIISDSSGKSRSLEVEGVQSTPFLGRRVGEMVQGSVLGLRGSLLITGGSDKDGFPLVPSVRGGVKKSILLSEGVGFRAKFEGERRRKLVRGNLITEDVVQINLRLLEEPDVSGAQTETKTEKERDKEKDKDKDKEKKERDRNGERGREGEGEREGGGEGKRGRH